MERFTWILFSSLLLLYIAEIDGRCLVEEIPHMGDFDTNRFSGVWYILSMMQDTARFTTGVLKFSVTSSGMSSVFSGALRDECFPDMPGTWTRVGSNAEMFSDYGPVKGPAKIVYASPRYDYAISYQCFQVSPDGTCAMRFVDIIGRKPGISPGVKRALMSHINGLCVKLADFTDLSSTVPHCLQHRIAAMGRADTMMGDAPVEDQALTDFAAAYNFGDEEEDYEEEGSFLKEIGDVTHEIKADIKMPIHRANHTNKSTKTVQVSDVTMEEEVGGASSLIDTSKTEVVRHGTLTESDVVEELPEHKETVSEIATEEGSQDREVTEEDTKRILGEIDEEDEGEEEEEEEDELAEGGEDEEDEKDEEEEQDVVQVSEDDFSEDLPTEERRCPTPMCSDRCPGGYHYTEQGCMTCKCKEVEDSGSASALLQMEVLNVEQCQVCRNTCSLGFKKDENGCPYRNCSCVDDAPDIEVELSQVPQVSLCPNTEHRCARRCPHGYLTDNNGCATCRCTGERVVCAVPMCSKPCSSGYVYTEVGCMTCKCKGKWYMLSMLGGTARFSSGVIHLNVINDTHLASYFSASQGSQCSPTVRGSLQMDENGELWARYGSKSGPVKIRYVDADYTYAIAYQCFDVQEDGTCTQAHIDLLGRTQELPAGVRTELMAHLDGMCVGPEDFVDLSQAVHCLVELPPSTRPCKVSDFKPVSDIDWNRMLGHWYSGLQPDGGEHLQAGEYLLRKDEKLSVGNSLAMTIIFHAYKNGQCIEPREATIYPSPSTPGQLTMQLGHVKIDGRVIYNDYSSMVFYQCSKVARNGSCAHNHATVEVLIRNRRSTVQHSSYEKIIKDLCIDPKQIVPVSHEVTCPIVDICKVEDIPRQPNLDLKRFSGAWHTLGFLKTDALWTYASAVFTMNNASSLTVWYNGEREGVCAPTAKATITSNGNSGNMSINFGRSKADYKIAFTDYDLAITYECEKKLRHGSCAQNAEHVEILSRSEGPLTEEMKTRLELPLSKLCKDIDDMRFTQKQEECALDVPADACKMDYLPTVTNFDINQFMGQWYTVSTNWVSSDMTSQSIEMTLSARNKITVGITARRGGQCHRIMRKVIKPRPGHPSEFISLRGHHQVRFQVLYVSPDYQYALVYKCSVVTEEGACAPGHTKVNLMSRDPSNMDAAIRRQTNNILVTSCVDPNLMRDMDHTAECSSATISGEPTPSACTLNNMPALKKLDTKQFLGRWYIVWRMRKSPTPDGAAEVDLSTGDEEMAISATYNGARHGHCLKPMKTLWTLISTDLSSDFMVKSPNARGRVKVLYTNYEYALVYECYQETGDDHCVQGQSSLDIYSRSRDIPASLKEQLTKRAVDVCMNGSSFEQVNHDITCDLIRRDCSLSHIPVVTRIDLRRLMGIWYSNNRLASSPTWDSGLVNFELLEGNTILAKFTGSRKGACMKAKAYFLQPIRGDNEFSKANGGVVKIVYTDFERLLLYECDIVLEDGTCDPEALSVDIIGRTRDVITTSELALMTSYISDMCLDRSDFTNTQTTVDCSERLYEDDECILRMDEIPVQKRIDINLLLGEWYGYAHSGGEEAFSSTKYLLSRDPATGTLNFFFTGSKNGLCTPTTASSIEFKDLDELSSFTIHKNGKIGNALILLATPDELVVYKCFLKLHDGTCADGHVVVEVFARRQNMLAGMSPRVRRAVSQACFTPAEFHLTIHDVDCPLNIPHETCEYVNIPVQKQFDTRALTGHWYTVSRLTPRGDLKRQSGQHEINFVSSRQLGIVWAGKVENFCMRAKRGVMVQVVNNTQPGVYKTSFGSWTGVTKFIHLSDLYAITYECIQTGGAPIDLHACPVSEAEVEIHSRSRRISPSTLNVLKDILRRKTCVDVNRMDDLDPKDTCAFPELKKKSCKVDEIPVQHNIPIGLLAGAWFVIGYTDSVSVLPKTAGEMFIDATAHYDGVITFHMRESHGQTMDDCTNVYRLKAFSASLDRAKWMFMIGNSVTRSSGTMRIIYVDKNLLIIHSCLGWSKRHIGFCEQSKESVLVFSRRRNINTRERALVFNKMRDNLCVGEEDLIVTNHTERCGIPRFTKKGRRRESCLVSDYKTKENFEPRRFGGDWYEVERTRHSRLNHWESPVSQFRFLPPSGLHFQHAGTKDGKCVGPFQGHVISNKPMTSPGNMTLWVGGQHLIGSPWAVNYPFKVIWTDYRLAIIYACSQLADDGTCRRRGEQLHILSRSPDVSSSARIALYNIIRKELCVDIFDLVVPAKEADCLRVFATDGPAATLNTEGCDMSQCDRDCPSGYVIDATGCEVCECRVYQEDRDMVGLSGDNEEKKENLLPIEMGPETEEPVKKKIIHKKFNRYDSMPTDEGSGDGDDEMETEMLHEICPPLKCTKRCPQGFQLSDRGCLLCECLTEENEGMYEEETQVIHQPDVPPSPDEEENGRPPTRNARCKPTFCFFLYCPNGLKQDENGCRICTCRKGSRPTDTDPRPRPGQLIWVNKATGNGVKTVLVNPSRLGARLGAPRMAGDGSMASDGAIKGDSPDVDGPEVKDGMLKDASENFGASGPDVKKPELNGDSRNQHSHNERSAQVLNSKENPDWDIGAVEAEVLNVRPNVEKRKEAGTVPVKEGETEGQEDSTMSTKKPEGLLEKLLYYL